jgi:hypothetical protein
VLSVAYLASTYNSTGARLQGLRHEDEVPQALVSGHVDRVGGGNVRFKLFEPRDHQGRRSGIIPAS